MNYPIIKFKNKFTEIDEFEMPLKGVRDDIIVECPNGFSYSLCFYDIARLSQELETENIIFHEGLIIVEEVNMNNIENAINIMWDSNFFGKMKPIEK